MKRGKRNFELFSLSFLDIISCGFAAVVMLILLFKPAGDVPDKQDGAISRTAEALAEVLALTRQSRQLHTQIEAHQATHDALSEQRVALQEESQRLTRAQAERSDLDASLQEQLQGLRLVQSSLERASVVAPAKQKQRDEEIGGIPVDSDYVVFVVDTSGSMRQIWSRVSQEIVNVLSIHPKVKGFQVLSDLGKSVVSAYEGRWIPDTPARRQRVISVFRNWAVSSNSNPVEGIQTALSRYARPGIRTAIYVFGDDYTGGSYLPVIDRITARNRVGGKRLARIHAIAFLVPQTTDRFSILMRELTRRNGGTFLALPL